MHFKIKITITTTIFGIYKYKLLFFIVLILLLHFYYLVMMMMMMMRMMMHILFTMIMTMTIKTMITTLRFLSIHFKHIIIDTHFKKLLSASFMSPTSDQTCSSTRWQGSVQDSEQPHSYGGRAQGQPSRPR